MFFHFDRTRCCSVYLAMSYIQASRIEIETGREMDADTDGEVYGTTPCTIEVKKHHLTMLVPEDSQ